ncbi:hypothetical protein [Croceibacterium ferulae]|uniref:hypothetical protein n=1 Tax=Croceibacterium ferulae TaxID=1854641 RepID=UPI000EB093FC|nr:hypothetical protein [Croceibacterium ferulae]
MIARARTGLGGWQTTLADLALILFLVSASALDRQEDAAPPTITVPQQGAPAAIWREGAGAPPLAEWLAGEQHDARLQLTLLATPADGARALALAADLPGARVVVQPAKGQDRATGITAVLAYDRLP